MLVLGLGATPEAPRAQATRPAGAGPPSAVPRWRVSAPEAARAWFAVLADHGLEGDGVFRLTTATPPGDGTTRVAGRRLAAVRNVDVLHFVPLYHPSADRRGLAEALRAAADDSTPGAPRAAFLISGLRRALAPEARREWLPVLAAAVAARAVPAADAAALAAWEGKLASEWEPALRPWLRAESLDMGHLLVIPAVGAEGRLFAATPAREDNLVAVGAFATDPDRDAPLHAFTREVCFPAVSRAAQAARFAVGDAAAARRASLAAVRCGALLLDARLPARREAYRAFWLRQSGAPGAGPPPALLAAFDEAFPADPAFESALVRAIARIREAP